MIFDLKHAQPTWPQTILICASGMVFCFLGYLLSRLRHCWGATAWLVLALLILAAIGFLAAVLLFYLRPQYGSKALPFFLLLLLGHVMLIAVLWRIGVVG